MKFKLNDIVKRVYSLLDENETIIEERVEYGDPGTMLRGLIIDLIPDAARVVLNSAPLSAVDEYRSLRDLPVEKRGSQTLLRLPDDFLRLVCFKMNGTERGVTEPLAFGGEEYMLRAAGSTRRSRPAVAISHAGAEKTLEIFGDCGAVAERLDYLAVPAIDGQHIDLPPGLFGDVCAKTAEMVTAIIERP